MTSPKANGACGAGSPRRRDASPRLELRGSSATPEEAAAVMAAVEQFMRDTAPPPAPAAPAVSGWVRAARLEAVGGWPDAGAPPILRG